MITKTLNECLSLIIDRRGVTPKKLGSNWSDKGYRVLSANNVKTTGLQNEDEIRYIDEDTYKKWMKEEIQKGDLLLTSEAPAGEIMYWDSEEKIVAGQRIFILRVANDINPLYLKYYLQSKKGQAEIKNKCSGSTVFGISAKTFDSIEISLPENKLTQDKIANLLYSIDKKIENNNKINKELETITRTIYNYWFLQFEFPTKEGKTYKSSGQKMLWSEELKQEIPKNWEVINIGDLADLYQPEFISDKDLKKDGNYFVYGANGIIGNYDKYNHENSEIAITCRGTSCGNIHMTLPQSWITGNSMVVSPKNNFKYKEYLYYTLNPEIIKKFISGSAQPQITRANLVNLKIVKPSLEEIKKFEDIAQKTRIRSQLNMLENQKLSSLRDFLLPLLINGQINFKDN